METQPQPTKIPVEESGWLLLDVEGRYMARASGFITQGIVFRNMDHEARIGRVIDDQGLYDLEVRAWMGKKDSFSLTLEPRLL